MSFYDFVRMARKVRWDVEEKHHCFFPQRSLKMQGTCGAFLLCIDNGNDSASGGINSPNASMTKDEMQACRLSSLFIKWERTSQFTATTLVFVQLLKFGSKNERASRLPFGA